MVQLLLIIRCANTHTDARTRVSNKKHPAAMILLAVFFFLKSFYIQCLQPVKCTEDLGGGGKLTKQRFRLWADYSAPKADRSITESPNLDSLTVNIPSALISHLLSVFICCRGNPALHPLLTPPVSERRHKFIDLNMMPHQTADKFYWFIWSQSGFAEGEEKLTKLKKFINKIKVINKMSDDHIRC